ncbi:MAG: hypothetical protein A4S17_05400 [Proteobacteria bacterium HN_bin10]|nr:MAG: hypothetical protein A4S17_05400 [Proteobacteria bacterium HN_bin10]
MLVRHGFQLGFAAPLKLVLDYYEQGVSFLLGWATPCLSAAVAIVEKYVSIDLTLHDHWKHIFVLMWIYLLGDFRAYWERGRYLSAVLIFTGGLLIVLVSSVAGGAAALNDPRLWIVVFPACGFVFYEAAKSPLSATFYRREGDTWWQTCRYYLATFAFTNAIAGGAGVVFGGWASRVGLPNPGLLALLVFFVVVVLRNISVGIRYAALNKGVLGGTWGNRFLRSATARLGVLLVAILVGASLFIAFNAGLKLAGL